jgi:hypothetical protein
MFLREQNLFCRVIDNQEDERKGRGLKAIPQIDATHDMRAAMWLTLISIHIIP